jgi:hypothetical protein
MVPLLVEIVAVATVGPPRSGDIVRSILAEVGFAGFGQGPHPGAGLFAMIKRFIGKLKFTDIPGGNNTTPGLDFDITIDLRQLVVVTTHTELLLPEQASERCDSGAMSSPKLRSATALRTFAYFIRPP